MSISSKSETRPSVGVNRAKEVGRFPEREGGMEQLSKRQAVNRPGTYVTARQH